MRIVTAYRQRTVEIAQLLRTRGPTKTSAVVLALCGPTARSIMYRDVYGWFERVGLGV